jgi:hypothetical protein
MRITALAAVTILVSLTGCASLSTVTETAKNYPLESAALADTVTTELALQHPGVYEMNPMGPLGAAAAKLILIKIIKPKLTEDSQQFLTQWGTAVWTAAAVNNLMIYLVHTATPVGTVLAVISGIYTYTELEPKQQAKPKE